MTDDDTPIYSQSLEDDELVQPPAVKPKLGAKGRPYQPPQRDAKLPDDPNDRRGRRALALDRDLTVDVEGSSNFVQGALVAGSAFIKGPKR